MKEGNQETNRFRAQLLIVLVVFVGIAFVVGTWPFKEPITFLDKKPAPPAVVYKIPDGQLIVIQVQEGFFIQARYDEAQDRFVETGRVPVVRPQP